MYDLEVPALARESGEAGAGAEIVKHRPDVIRKRRWRLTPPMYDGQHARRPQAAAGRLLMYDVRFSMYDLQIMRSGAADGEQATRMRCPDRGENCRRRQGSSAKSAAFAP